MRRLGSTLILSAILFLLAPVHADAFWRWLDELSGPGPYWGGEFEFRLVCFSLEPKPGDYDWSKLFENPALPYGGDPSNVTPPPTNDPNSRPDDQTTQLAQPELRGSIRSVGPIGVKSGCIFKPVPLENKRLVSVNLAMGYQWARRPNLVYEDASRQRHIDLVSVRPSVWLRVSRSLEVGTGFGSNHFIGTGFRRFHKYSVEFFQAEWKPIAQIRDVFYRDKPSPKHDGFPDTQYDQLLSVRFGLLKYPGGFKASDFGATTFRDGSTKVDDELMYTFSICFDLEPFFRLKRAVNCRENPKKCQK